MRIIKISSLMQGALETQRPHLDERCIEYYMTHFEGTEPVLVYEDAGELILVDGHHRVEAARRLNETSIRANLKAGTRQDALLYRGRPSRIPWSTIREV